MVNNEDASTSRAGAAPVPRWAVATIVTLAATVVGLAAGILAHADGASFAGAARAGGAAFAAAAGILLAMAVFLSGRQP
jgi:hypothetical protein